MLNSIEENVEYLLKNCKHTIRGMLDNATNFPICYNLGDKYYLAGDIISILQLANYKAVQHSHYSTIEINIDL